MDCYGHFLFRVCRYNMYIYSYIRLKSYIVILPLPVGDYEGELLFIDIFVYIVIPLIYTNIFLVVSQYKLPFPFINIFIFIYLCIFTTNTYLPVVLSPPFFRLFCRCFTPAPGQSNCVWNCKGQWGEVMNGTATMGGTGGCWFLLVLVCFGFDFRLVWVLVLGCVGFDFGWFGLFGFFVCLSWQHDIDCWSWVVERDGILNRRVLKLLLLWVLSWYNRCSLDQICLAGDFCWHASWWFLMFILNKLGSLFLWWICSRVDVCVFFFARIDVDFRNRSSFQTNMDIISVYIV